MRKTNMKFNKSGKSNPWLVVLSIVAILILGFLSYGYYQNTAVGGSGAGAGSGGVAVNPTATYSTSDKFTTTSVGGTAYYKELGVNVNMDSNGNVVGGKPYQTGAISNVNPGTNYAYFVLNGSSYKVQPAVFTATPLNNLVSNNMAYANSSISLAGYDTTNRATTTSGAYNSSMAAGITANEQFTYQGIYQKSALPFGGLLAIEMNSSINSVTCSGQGLSAGQGNFHITYTPTNLQNKVVLFKLDNTFDTGAGALQQINCQFQNSGTAAGAGSVYKAQIFPAAYYLGNDGNFYLDVEKSNNNGDTTRTAPGALPAFTGYWGA